MSKFSTKNSPVLIKKNVWVGLRDRHVTLIIKSILNIGLRLRRSYTTTATIINKHFIETFFISKGLSAECMSK